MPATRAHDDPTPEHDPTPAGPAEKFLHYLAREGQTILRIILILSIAAAAICMATIWILAFIPLVVFAVAYVLLALCGRVERATRTVDDDRRQLEAEQAEQQHRAEAENRPARHPLVPGRELPPGVLWHDATIVGEVLIALGVGAALIAVILLPREARIIGAVVFFAYMMLLMAPVWLAWFTQQGEAAREEQDDDDRRRSV